MDILEEQKKYFQAKHKECQKRPDLNQYLIKDIEKYIDKIESFNSFEEYGKWVNENGAYFSTSQAEQKDMYTNFIKIQKFFNNKKREEYYAKKLEAVDKSTDHLSLNKNLTEIETVILNDEKQSWQAIQWVVNMYIIVMEYITAPDTKKDKVFSEVKEKWSTLKKYDPEINLEKILSYPPYRNVCIFEDERIIELFSNIREVMK